MAVVLVNNNLRVCRIAFSSTTRRLLLPNANIYRSVSPRIHFQSNLFAHRSAILCNHSPRHFFSLMDFSCMRMCCVPSGHSFLTLRCLVSLNWFSASLSCTVYPSHLLLPSFPHRYRLSSASGVSVLKFFTPGQYHFQSIKLRALFDPVCFCCGC